MRNTSLLKNRSSRDDWIRSGTNTYSVDQYIEMVDAWKQQLPDYRYCMLLVEDRLNFLVGMGAVLSKGQTLILPSNKTSHELEALMKSYPDIFLLVDGEMAIESDRILDCRQFSGPPAGPASIPEIADDHLAALIFTSGSTGEPTANKKYWADLVRSTSNIENHFDLDSQDYLVATVPPQHMFGLETTILVPLLTGAAVFSGRPFFPQDIHDALMNGKGLRTLVTTPVHLRACVAAGLEWPEMKQIISATAPLDPALARQAEELFVCPVIEIYGSTETGALATRRTIEGDRWKMYDGMKIYQHNGKVCVSGDHLPQDVVLSDLVELEDSQSFLLLGRQDDMLKIGGKRASLKDLNIKLNSIPGVLDGVFVQPEEKTKGTARLVALVVAPGLSPADITDALSGMIDRVFLPRPLYIVESLPRNETEKLPRKAVNELLAALSCP